MHDTDMIGNYYTLAHVALFTGLTDRTLRSYLSSGLLQGEKINNLWHFTPEQVDAFIHHPSVRPSITAKNNALVYDFLTCERKRVRCSKLQPSSQKQCFWDEKHQAPSRPRPRLGAYSWFGFSNLLLPAFFVLLWVSA